MSEIIQGDCLEVLKTIHDKSIDCCVTSPPYYGLRDYGCEGQIGLEETPEQYVQRLVDVFREVKRVLQDDGTLWLNLGDTYNASTYKKDENSSGHGKQGTNKGSYENVVERPHDKNCKTKDLIGIPWMTAFALRADGWYLRQDIIWHKPNPMPESVKDRCTKSHEYIFLLSKKPHYYFDYEAIQEPATTVIGEDAEIRFGGNKYGDNDDSHFQTYSGNVYEPSDVKNKRDVWNVCTMPVKEAHFATFPEELIEPCIKAGSRVNGTVLDPFFGSGTTGRVAIRLNREYIGIDLNPEYIEIAKKRTSNVQMSLEGLMKVSEEE